mgnify:FL=1
MRISLIILVIFTTSFSSFGQWYEAQGQAVIKNGDTTRAKTRAMENALKKALLVAGASVSSVQQVVNGLITQDEISVRASGSVNSLELVSENYADDIVTITIRADIFPREKQCFSSDYRKTLLLTRSNLLNREQANIGGIYAIDKVMMQKLAAKLNNEGRYLDTKLVLKSKTEFSRLNESLNAEGIKSLTMSLSDLTDTQYVMYSEISDISFAREVNNSWQFWQEDIFDRYFNIALYIYNGTKTSIGQTYAIQSLIKGG